MIEGGLSYYTGDWWGIVNCGCAFVFVSVGKGVLGICMDRRESLLYWRECLLFVIEGNDG